MFSPGCTEGNPKEFRGARAWAYGNLEGGGTMRGRNDIYAAMGPYGSVRNSWLTAKYRSQDSRKRALTSESWSERTVLHPRRELYRARSYVVNRRHVGLIRAHSREHTTTGQVHRRGVERGFAHGSWLAHIVALDECARHAFICEWRCGTRYCSGVYASRLVKQDDARSPGGKVGRLGCSRTL